MRIVLAGFGSVGRAAARMLADRAGDLHASGGLAPKLVGVIDSRGAAVSERGLEADELVRAKEHHGSVGAMATYGVADVGDAAALIRELSADVLVESTPSNLANPTPAFNNIKAALSSGKHAISVNKAPLALAMPALLELAAYNRVQLRYSGTVGAGTPVLTMARSLSRGDRIEKIRGILNGTTNFILWKMKEEGSDYASALAEAQKLGFAETDPTTDVDGIDTATKVVILANAIFGKDARATMQDVRVTGIRGVSAERIREAGARGQTIKLIGEIDATQAGCPRLSVSPQEVPMHGPLDVPRGLNAVQYTLRTAGEVTVVGRGAGGPETATAIIRDLVDIWHSTAN